MEDKMQWFVVNVHTGCEDKVARGLREQIDKRRLNAFFGEILVPTREVVEIKAGKRVKSEKKFFPGYIVVQMIMKNETFSPYSLIGFLLALTINSSFGSAMYSITTLLS